MTIPFLSCKSGDQKSVRASHGPAGPGQLAGLAGRGSCGNSFVVGAQKGGQLPSLAADPLGFVNKKDSHWRRGLDWVAAPPLASGPSLGSYPRPVLSAIAAPNSKYEIFSCPIAQSRKHEKGTKMHKTWQRHWSTGLHTEKRYEPRFQIETAIINQILPLATINCVQLYPLRA